MLGAIQTKNSLATLFLTMRSLIDYNLKVWIPVKLAYALFQEVVGNPHESEMCGPGCAFFKP